MHLTAEELQRMSEADIRQADREQLTDLGRIAIDRTQTSEERRQSYLMQAGNPYLVRSGEYVLKFRYADSEKTFEECMEEYYEKKVSGCMSDIPEKLGKNGAV